MSALFEAVQQCFREEEWPAVRPDGEPLLQLPYEGDNGHWLCYAQVNEANRHFVFYSVWPGNAPADRRLAAAEFITRANYGLPIGNFEMDYADGEIRFKTSIDVTDCDLTPAHVRQLVYTNVALMDLYLPGLLAVLYGKIDPATAVLQAEAAATP